MSEEKKIVPEVIPPMMMEIDRNWLAQKSTDFIAVITDNQIKDPQMKDGIRLQQSLLCKGANELILEILEKFDNVK